MTENYVCMLMDISVLLAQMVAENGYNIRETNSNIAKVALKFSMLQDDDRLRNDKLQNVSFVNELTNQVLDLITGYKNYPRSCSAGATISFPAWELKRVISGRCKCDFKTLWTENGGILISGKRMIALKNDPIWKAISLFEFPFPPFNYCRCMGVEDVEYNKCLKLGLFDKDYKTTNMVFSTNFNNPESILQNVSVLDFFITDLFDKK